MKVDPEINMDELVTKFEGYSGADITNVCRDASYMAMRKRLQGLKRDKIMEISAEEMDKPLTNKDFDEALSKVQPSVSKDDIKQYENWMNEFGSA